MSDNRPIGIFDSGVGGLTVARAIMDQLPHESIHYIGDTRNAPYGPKPAEQVREFSRSLADELVSRGIKMLVIACNTATSVFLSQAQELYGSLHGLPVLGVVEPAVRRAVKTTRNGKIGVLGTKGTINSGTYQHQIAIASARREEQGLPPLEAIAQPAPRFVDFVERGITTGRQILGVAQAYVAPLQVAGVDTLVLGCTHYPLLTGVIQIAIGDDVTLVSSSEETAKDVVAYLMNQDMLASEDNEPERRFESTGDPRLFAQLATRFVGHERLPVNWFEM
ncbi:MAG: glutamate racemase [Corynebacterium sp.]|nr:glutamate racemase [Corynebacterium sp.]